MLKIYVSDGWAGGKEEDTVYLELKLQSSQRFFNIIMKLLYVFYFLLKQQIFGSVVVVANEIVWYYSSL